MRQLQARRAILVGDIVKKTTRGNHSEEGNAAGGLEDALPPRLTRRRGRYLVWGEYEWG